MRRQLRGKDEILQSMQSDYEVELQETKHRISKLERSLSEQDQEDALNQQELKPDTPASKVTHSSSDHTAATASIPIPRAVVGRERSVVLTTRTAKGEPHPHGGERVQARLTLKGSAETAISTRVCDNQDGTYMISFTTRQVGYHELNITIRTQLVKKCPYTLYSRKRRTYASFDSPQKAFRCSYSPWGIAVSDSMELYVTNTGGCIQVFDHAGRNIRNIGSKGNREGRFRNPLGITIHGDAMYIADTYNHRIQKLSLNGTFLSKFGTKGSSQPFIPYGICLDQDGRVFVADLGNSRVSVFGEDGAFLYHITGDPSTDSQLVEPRGMAFDPFGNLHVVDYKLNSVKVFSVRGNYKTQYGKGYLEKPMYIAIDEEGYAFVSDDRLSVFDPQHNVIHSTAKFDSTGVVLDKYGCVYIGNNALNNFEVLKF